MKIEKFKIVQAKSSFNPNKKLPSVYFATKKDLANPELRSAKPTTKSKILSVRYD